MSDGRFEQSNPGGYPPHIPQPQTHAHRSTEGQPRVSPEQQRHGSARPGWLARSLFWVAIVVGHLPALIIFPLMASGDPAMVGIFMAANLVAGGVRLLAGTAAMLVVKDTTWTRRVVAGGIYLMACLFILVVVPFTPLIMNELAGGAADSLATANIVTSVQSAILLALMFIAWNIARNRRWWILIAAFVYAGISIGVEAALRSALSAGEPVQAGANALTQLLALALTFIGLGVFHLLGRIRGACVPPPAQKPKPAGQWGPVPSAGGAVPDRAQH